MQQPASLVMTILRKCSAFDESGSHAQGNARARRAQTRGNASAALAPLRVDTTGSRGKSILQTNLALDTTNRPCPREKDIMEKSIAADLVLRFVITRLAAINAVVLPSSVSRVRSRMHKAQYLDTSSVARSDRTRYI